MSAFVGFPDILDNSILLHHHVHIFNRNIFADDYSLLVYLLASLISKALLEFETSSGQGMVSNFLSLFSPFPTRYRAPFAGFWAAWRNHRSPRIAREAAVVGSGFCICTWNSFSKLAPYRARSKFENGQTSCGSNTNPVQVFREAGGIWLKFLLPVIQNHVSARLLEIWTLVRSWFYFFHQI